MKGYVIEAYCDMGNAYSCKRLMEEAAKKNISLNLIGVHDTIICEDGIYCRNEKLTPCEFVINRYKWGKVKDAMNQLAEKSFNNLALFQKYINKYEQLLYIDSSNFEKPKYILANADIVYGDLSERLGNRIVAKGLENSMGREIFLLENEEDFQKLKQFGSQKEWLFEEFIDTSYGRDVRVYSIRGEVVACMMRSSKNDFRANVALGGSTIAYETTDEIRSIARDIYKQTGLDFVGIDLLFGKSGFYFCEINVMPGLEGIEKASGVNVAAHMIDMIYGDFS